MLDYFDEVNDIAKIVLGRELVSKNHVKFDYYFNELLDNPGLGEFFKKSSAGAKAEMLALANKENFVKLCGWLDNNDFSKIVIASSLDQLRIILKKIHSFDEVTEILVGDDFKGTIESFPEEKKLLVNSFLEKIEDNFVPRGKKVSLEEILNRHNKLLSENAILKSENEKLVSSFKEKISQLEAKNAEVIQKRIDDNLSGYVQESVSSLKIIEDKLKDAAARWSFLSIVVLFFGFSAGIGFSLFGYAFGPNLKDLNWPELLIFSIKGIFIVSAFVAAAGYSFMKSNAFTHEAIIVSNRAHAIKFGQLYLDIYGNTVERGEMQKIFENWNISSDTAFLKHKNDKSDPVKFSEFLDSLKKVKELIPGIGKD